MSAIERRRLRLRRKKKTRKQLRSAERPQLLVYRSGKHIYAQLVDSGTGRTLTGASTRTPAVREGLESTKDVDAALIAARHQLPGARPEDDSLLTTP